MVPGSVSSWTGIPAANGDITELTLTGGMDILYPIGAVVMSTATSSWANELISALLVSHNPDGTLRGEAIPEIPDKSITTDKINFTSIPMFSATTAPEQWPALDSTKDVIVPFDTIEYDTAKMLDTKTYRATIPKKGIYHIHARCGIASAGFNPGTTALIRIFKNDNIFKESQRITGSGNSMTIPIPTLDCDALLEKGDVLDVRARCTDSRNFGGGSSQSEFNIRFVAEV